MMYQHPRVKGLCRSSNPARLVLVLLTVALGILHPMPATQAADITAKTAATLTVDTTEDKIDLSCSDGDCSLRDAILTANDDDTINIPAGTYTLALGQLNINKSLTLSGTGALSTTVQAATEPNIAGWRVFNVTGAGRITVTISGLTIRHGNIPDDVYGYGGALRNSETVILSDCIITSNTAYETGAIYNSDDGTMTIINSTIYGNRGGGNGGGISNDGGTITITNSTISGNVTMSVDGSGGIGGGIYNYSGFPGGTVTIINSTVVGNVAPGNGGGIYNSTACTMTIHNSTIAGNVASRNGGGIYNHGGTVTTTHSTVAGNVASRNGGGIFNQDDPSSIVTLHNSIVAENSVGDTDPDCTGPFISGGYNLVGDVAGSTGITATTDITGTDALLGPLADNSGDTHTRALLPGSPAIDQGSCSDVTADQRGYTRPIDFPHIANADDGCDIGAYEAWLWTGLPLIFRN
jgi:CSLREA domain-containing protein